MAWVVDTSVLVDLITGDPSFEPASTACLQSYLPDGLVISPVTFVEPGPSFSGDEAAAGVFLQCAGIGFNEYWTAADTQLAHCLWHEFQRRRRQLQSPKRPVADVMIAAFAARFQGIITRIESDFRNILPTLRIVVP